MVRLPYVGLDPAISVGLGHLVRVASLRSILRVPSEILGPFDARLREGGLSAHRRLFRSRRDDPAVWVVDSGHLPRAVIRRRLERPATPVVWIRRGLFKPEQVAIQAGYLQFVDMVLAPDEAVPQQPDAVAALADAAGKLARVGVAHAYQALSHGPHAIDARVFLALGAFAPHHRALFVALKRKLEARGIPYLWSSRDRRPLFAGFAPTRRIPVARALAAKACCSALVGEAGYNSVYEGLHLGRPMLLLANETEGREAQQERVALAKSISPNVFDAGAPGDLEAWLEIAAETGHPTFIPAAVADSHGLHQLAEQIERTFDVAITRTH